jgi:hypothetical protein
MSKPKTATEYETVQIGAALLARALFKELGIASAIDQAITSQPEIGATYGHLLQAVILNRLTFDPQPLYRMSEWAAQHGIDDLLGIDAAWLDDDRLGAGLDAIATHQIEIWVAILKLARQRFKLPLEELHGDTTSIYFEGEFDQTNVKPGVLRQNLVTIDIIDFLHPSTTLYWYGGITIFAVLLFQRNTQRSMQFGS